VLYRFKRPWRDGSRAVVLEPLAFVERLAALIPPPRRHQLTYHGVLAPAARLRERVVPQPEAGEPVRAGTGGVVQRPGKPSNRRGRARYRTWAELLRRVFRLDACICPRCGGPRRLIAFITDPLVAGRILDHLGILPEPQPPPLPGGAG